MKFKKPSGKAIQDTATLVGGGIVGGMASKGIFGAIHEKKAVTAADIKSETNMGYVKRAVLVAASAAAFAAIDGNDTLTTLIKGACAGVAITQTQALVADFAATNTTTANLATSSGAKDKFFARALGLACPCDQVGMGGARRKRNRNHRHMNGAFDMIPTAQPAFIEEYKTQTVAGVSDSLEAKFLAAKQAA